MSLVRPVRAVILGAPGAGKGTVLSKLIKRFDDHLTAISSGDLLRHQIKQNPKSEIAFIVSQGGLISDEVMINMIFDRFRELGYLTKSSKSWLLDGFPRNISQAKALDLRLNQSNLGLNLVIELDVPHEVILNRIRNRWIHAPSGRIYSLDYNPPKVEGIDDITGERLTKRPDDNVEVFARRLQLYNKLCDPMKQYYKEKGLLETVSGETSDIIFPKLLELIKNKYT